MCTVVFIPSDKKIQLASLRDENPQRPKALGPTIRGTDTIAYLSPVDGLAGGTWAGVSEFGNVIILLNGGHVNHQRQPYYSKSRGLIVTELLQSELPVVDWNLMDLTNTEPFTLVVWSDKHLFELVWDGQHQTKTLLDASAPHIWSSSTLYNADAKAYRSQLFRKWVSNRSVVDRLGLWEFFNTYKDPTNGYIMNRGPHIKTLSYSFIELMGEEKALFSYHDFATAAPTETEISIHHSPHHCCMG
jgi:hypothetical protein